MINNPLNILFEKNILTKPCYVDCIRNLRIILNLEQIGYILEDNISILPPPKVMGGVGKKKDIAPVVHASKSSKQGGKCFHCSKADY